MFLVLSWAKGLGEPRGPVKVVSSGSTTARIDYAAPTTCRQVSWAFTNLVLWAELFETCMLGLGSSCRYSCVCMLYVVYDLYGWWSRAVTGSGSRI